jgi:hypothetical protein
VNEWKTNLKNPQIILWSACESSDRSKHSDTTSVNIKNNIKKKKKWNKKFYEQA